jgi:hypothetical protein
MTVVQYSSSTTFQAQRCVLRVKGDRLPTSHAGSDCGLATHDVMKIIKNLAKTLNEAKQTSKEEGMMLEAKQNDLKSTKSNDRQGSQKAAP